MKTHELKIWPQWFDAVRAGSKTFEIRRDDRNFNVGDKLILEEYKPGVGSYTGRKLEKTIKYITRDNDGEGRFGLLPGYCVLGIG